MVVQQEEALKFLKLNFVKIDLLKISLLHLKWGEEMPKISRKSGVVLPFFLYKFEGHFFIGRQLCF